MRALFSLILALVTVQAVAAGTFTGTATATFNVRETIDGSATTVSKSGPLSISLTTDYSTLRWSLNWNVNLVMSGGPSQSFETDLLASGSVTSRRCASSNFCLATDDPSPLSFPDANGKAGAGTYILVGDSTWTLTDRIVTSTRTRTNSQMPVATGSVVNPSGSNINVYNPGSHFLTVLNYPTNITLTPGFSGSSIWDSPTWHNGTGTLTLGQIGPTNDTLEVYLSGFASTFTLIESPAGDLTSDGIVDAGDYVLWRKGPGPLAPFLSSYNVWRSNFGGSASGLGSSTAVPEPASLVMLLMAVALPMRRR